MEKTASSAKKITLEDFPVFQMKTTQQASEIAAYLENLAQGALSSQAHSLELPSMSHLSDFFDCSFLKLYDALRLLRESGYDYQFSSLEGAMFVWRQPHLKSKEY